MMLESADWSADTWDLRPELLPALARAISVLASHQIEGFTFEAMWAGDQAKAEQQVTLKELLQDIEANKIKNKVIFVL
jgi:hypothetical protein